MKKALLLMLLFVVLPFGFASAQNSKPKQDFEGCIRQYVARYMSVCEAADIVARGVAAACAPMPTSPIGAMRDDHGSQVRFDLEKAMHETAYGKALVALLDGRASSSAACAK